MKKKVIIASLFSVIMGIFFISNNALLDQLTSLVEAITRTHVVDGEGAYTKISSAKDGSYSHRVKVGERNYEGVYYPVYETESTWCCDECFFPQPTKWCYPYDDGHNTYKICSDFGYGIWTYARGCLKDNYNY